MRRDLLRVADGAVGQGGRQQLVRSAFGDRRCPASSTSVGQARAAEREQPAERRDAPGPAATRPARRRAVPPAPAGRRRSPSALIQSASTSTGNPARGRDRPAVDPCVHPGQRPPARPAAQQAGRRVDADAEAGAGAMRGQDRRRPCRTARRPGRGRRCAATWRPSACRNQSVASMVLYSSVPTSAVLASMPSETVAAARTSTARPSSARPVHEEQPLVRGEQVARPLAEPRVAGHRGRARWGLDDEPVRGHGQDPADVVAAGAGLRPPGRAARARAAATIGGGVRGRQAELGGGRHARAPRRR